MDEVIYEQLELFQVELIEEDGLDFSVEIKPPKVKKKRKKRGNKHRSREVFQELIKTCTTYVSKINLSLKQSNKSVCWEDFAKETLETKQDSCEICGSKNKLTLHHIRYDNVTYETYEKDIMIMCDSHHYIFEKQRTSLSYPKLREQYGIILIKRFFDPNNVTESLREINYLMNRGRIGYQHIVDIDFDHHITLTNVINNFRSSPFSDGGR